MSLAEFLERLARPAGDGDAPPLRVLIFEQFEELFTKREAGQQERLDFFRQVRDALKRDRLLRVVFSLREDYIAELEPFARYMPDGFRTRYRLKRLFPHAALRALTGPLEGTPFSFAPGVAERILSNLLAVRRVDRSGAFHEIEGEFIEPVQLGVVCEFLWQRVASAGVTT